MKKHQGIPLFNPPFFYNRPMIDRRKCSIKKQKTEKQFFYLSKFSTKAGQGYINIEWVLFIGHY